MSIIYTRSMALTEWARDNLDPYDPRLFELLHEESERRWSHTCIPKNVTKYAKKAYMMIRHGTY